eukprot:gnl/MRDRNA2_/MRDRNA2_60287_c0_seq1.p1 gnl/MRDRNA2_/MRDRNA2_60287_c0~~gnl/MRDRNA2_/MRDRNA2_60287_c0_seq1.p1  ORF type:complete len:179 (-),score=1.34 gnl/MRDRNA2_/MRDRNA2_60287_c0_seq1:150-686(-)
MFYMVEMEKKLMISPNHITPFIKKFLYRKICEEVEDTCVESVGCVIAVHSLNTISEGLVHYDTGSVMFAVRFNCVVSHPKNNDVIDVVVHDILETYVVATAGPNKIFINRKNLGRNTFEFITINGVACFVAKNLGVKICTGSELRVRILGFRRTKVESVETYVCIGTLADHYLGVIAR